MEGHTYHSVVVDENEDMHAELTIPGMEGSRPEVRCDIT